MSEPKDNTQAQSAKPDMSSEEVEALLSNVESGAVASGTGVEPLGRVTRYDLAARDKIHRGRMPALDCINERWVGAFEQELKERIQRPVEVAIAKVEVQSYGEWLAGSPTPTCFNVYTVKPWRGNAVIAVDARLLFLLVDGYYGGGKVSQPAVRPVLTRTEQRLNRIVVDALTKHFAEAFKPVAQIELQLQRTEINPHYASIATPTETVLVSGFTIKLGEAEGRIALVFPLSMLDPVRARLDEGLRTATPESQARWQRGLRRDLQDADLELTGVFVQTALSIKDLLSLKPGDVLPIEMPKTATLRAGGRALLRGKFGRSRGYNAIKIVEAVQAAEPKA